MSPTLKFRQVLRMLDGGKLVPLPSGTVVSPTLVVALQQWHDFEHEDEQIVPRVNFYDGGMWVDVPFVSGGAE